MTNHMQTTCNKLTELKLNDPHDVAVNKTDKYYETFLTLQLYSSSEAKKKPPPTSVKVKFALTTLYTLFFLNLRPTTIITSLINVSTFIFCFIPTVFQSYLIVKCIKTSSVKRLIMINHIQNDSFSLHNVCILCIFIMYI